MLLTAAIAPYMRVSSPRAGELICLSITSTELTFLDSYEFPKYQQPESDASSTASSDENITPSSSSSSGASGSTFVFHVGDAKTIQTKRVRRPSHLFKPKRKEKLSGESTAVLDAPKHPKPRTQCAFCGTKCRSADLFSGFSFIS
jgi:hypothetical protein